MNWVPLGSVVGALVDTVNLWFGGAVVEAQVTDTVHGLQATFSGTSNGDNSPPARISASASTVSSTPGPLAVTRIWLSGGLSSFPTSPTTCYSPRASSGPLYFQLPT